MNSLRLSAIDVRLSLAYLWQATMYVTGSDTAKAYERIIRLQSRRSKVRQLLDEEARRNSIP